MQRSRRALLRRFTLTLTGLALSATAGCGVVDLVPGRTDRTELTEARPEPTARPAQPDEPGPDQISQIPPLAPPPTIEYIPAPIATTLSIIPGVIGTVVVPPTPTSL